MCLALAETDGSAHWRKQWDQIETKFRWKRFLRPKILVIEVGGKNME